jgi:hydrogenase maturation factor
VLVHVGFALTRLDEAEAERMLAMLAELGAMEELTGSTVEASAAGSFP